MIDSNLIEVFAIQKGDVISFIGGGGKTSTIFSLAQQLIAQNMSVIITTTTKMALPQKEDFFQLTKAATKESIIEDLTSLGYSFVAKKYNDEKCTGTGEEDLQKLSSLCDVMLIEADGAARKPIKIPNKTEPVIPAFSNRIIAVMGLSAFGKTLGESCFRYSEISHTFPYKKDAIIDEKIMADIASNSQGYLKNIRSMTPLYFLNQADTNSAVEKAQCIGKFIKEKVNTEVVIGSIHKGIFYSE